MRRFPYFFVLALTALACGGVFLLYSAGHGSFEPWAAKHAYRFAAALAVMLAVTFVSPRVLYKCAYPAYGVALTLLALVESPLGDVSMGAARWLKLGPITIQPAEPMKLALLLALARYFHDTGTAGAARLPLLAVPALMIAAPAGLILMQPDLGTAGVLTICGALVVFAAGIPLRFVFLAAGAVCAAAPIMWKFYLHGYQKQRVEVFLDPEKDPLGSGYNILQSVIAIGSGGLTGKGLTLGTQSQLDFLPEHQTDFIFTLLAEEQGFRGCFIALALYFFCCARMLSYAAGCRSRFGSLLACGASSLMFVHASINSAMVSGLLPVVGVPLPLISYGGTIMFSVMLACGLAANARVRGHEKW